MKRLILVSFLVTAVTGVLWSADVADRTVYRSRVVPIFFLVEAVGIVGIWSKDIAGGALSDGFFAAKENGTLFWPHLTAEFLTAGALGAGAVGLLLETDWSRPVSFLALGALGYTATSNLGWALAERERLPYAIPMLIGLAGAAVSFVILW
mgnify:CR=1 FL=1